MTIDPDELFSSSADQSRPTVGRQLGQVLYSLGIRRFYGLPGEDHMTLLADLAASGLEYLTAFNESAAVIMAATDAQLTGLPGVAVLSLAPGVSNGVNGLLNTYLDQIPLLVISGQHAGASLPLVVRQGFDLARLVSPMTKWQARPTARTDIGALIGKAIDEAMCGRPGPVYLEIPDDVVRAQAAPTRQPIAEVVLAVQARWRRRSAPAAPDEEALADLRELLSSARHPALVIGGRRRRIRPEIVARFAAAYRVPVFTSSRQKGLLGASSEFYAGTFLNGRFERAILGQSDRVILVDPDPFDFYNRTWCFDAPATAVVDDRFSEWVNPIQSRHVGCPNAVLAALVKDYSASASEWRASDVANYRHQLRADLLSVTGTGMSVAQAVDAALSGWPRDGYLVCDAGFSKPIVAMLSEPVHPDRFLASNSLSTMGYSIPAAIGARRAGAAPILAFLGDGSLLMRATELMTDRSGTACVFVTLLDRALTQIEVKQERLGLDAIGVALPTVSCAALAEAFGINGVDVSDTDALRAEVTKAMERPGTTLIGAVVDPAPSRPLFEMLRG